MCGEGQQEDSKEADKHTTSSSNSNNLVVVEGGPKGIRKFIRLMTERYSIVSTHLDLIMVNCVFKMLLLEAIDLFLFLCAY